MRINDLTQQQLTLISIDLAQLRLIADLTLAPTMPYFAEKPYPIGRCREIRDEVFTLLQAQLPHTQKPGLSLLKDLIAQGNPLQKAWGSLRDEYFQNAFIIGTWYIDVANDTVNANKPRVEILPLATSNFTPIKDFTQFVTIARSYWKVAVYRNDVCPALAPYMPLLCVGDNGTSWLGAANDDMLNIAIHSQFTQSKTILKDLPSPPVEIIQRWQSLLLNFTHDPLLTTKGDAITFCDEYSKKLQHPDLAHRDAAVIAYSSLPKSV
ncbi:MAG TPA: hypothetical protein ENH88_05020 [Pseudoalteromonas prydzensis]|uniref:Uncharacterized protein n=1 Tax=Pseudoalteromonas prydzensis TaxID=182141 RepID=A0A7V1CWY5_9GAMM|nr:hypothetical protein [Pseudoalteromonas prydzensis]HEA15807.1 hypothetical protein [Pseudoalteromonas prydzensis]